MRGYIVTNLSLRPMVLVLTVAMTVATSCGGSSTPTGGTGATNCGTAGSACCAANSCQGGGCCVAGRCVGGGSTCTGAGTSGTCSNGSCQTSAGVACGAVGQTCCGGGTSGAADGKCEGGFTTCTASGARCSGGSCVSCGNSRIDVLLGRRRQRLREQPFLSSRRWRIDLRAVRRQRGDLLCRGRLRKRARLRKSRERHARASCTNFCGATGGSCCPGGACQSAGRHGRHDGTGGTCVACAARGQSCCGGGGAATCNTGLACTDTTGSGTGGRPGGGATCQACGAAGEACCGRTVTSGLLCAGGGMEEARTVAKRAARKVSRAARPRAAVAAEPEYRGWLARPRTVVARAAVSSQCGNGELDARGLTFTTLVVANLALIVVNRSWRRSFFASLRVRNSRAWVGDRRWARVPVVGGLRAVPADAISHLDPSPRRSALAPVAGLAGVAWFEAVKIARLRRSRRGGIA